MTKARIISIYEDTQYKINFNQEEILELLKFKDIIGSNNLILQFDGTFMVRHYVGFLCNSKIKLQVLPKILDISEDVYCQNEEMENKAVNLLFHMLSYSGYFNVKEIPKATEISNYKNDLMEIFIAIFIKKFIEMFSFSIHRQYENIEENSSYIKGKIVFSENIRKNSYRNHLHYIRYDELTEDTLLNRIFKSIILKLIKETQNIENKKKLKISLSYLENVGVTILSNCIFDRIKFNRLNESYKPLFIMAKMFYYNLSPGLYAGDESTFTFLVKVNELFEEYLYKKLKDEIEKISNKKVLHHCPQRYLAKYGKTQAFLLIPDITIVENNNVTAILDAKYKRLFNGEEISVSQSDIYQMLAYSVRYDCNSIYLIYPKFLDVKDKGSYIKTYTIETGEKVINIKVFLFDLFNYEDVNSNTRLHII